MRKLFVFIFAIMMIPGLLFAGVATEIADGTSSTGIAFKTMIQCFAVIPHSADISLETYVGTTRTDSILVQRESPLVLTIPCDSIRVIRPTSTGVTIVPSYHSSKCPVIGSGINMYSVTSTDMIDTTWTANADSTATFSAEGVNVDGAQSLLLELEWVTFVGGMRVEHVFSDSANDTALTTLPIDTVSVVASALHSGDTKVTIPIYTWCGGLHQGYYYVRFWLWNGESSAVDSLTATLRIIK